MKTRIALAVILCALVFFVAGWTLKAARVQWEYETIARKTVAEMDTEAADINRRLEAYGKLGWELVTIEQYTRAGDRLTRLYFKRPKQ